jgi:hypothetical protein
VGTSDESAHPDAELTLLANLLREAEESSNEVLAQAVRKVIDNRLDELGGGD